MWGWIGTVLIATVLYALLFWGINRFGGDTDSAVPKLDWEDYKLNLNPAVPWDAHVLQVEFRGRLYKRICTIFTAAVLLQQAHLYKLAAQTYQKLRFIPLADGSVGDLYVWSEVFRHNWQLLEPHL